MVWQTRVTDEGGRLCGMSPLRQALIDYLAVRRALGYKLERAEKLLGQFPHLRRGSP